jgi:hypothetical protein
MYMGKSFVKQLAQGAEVLSGGEFGFEGSIICTILQVVFIAALIWYYQRKYGNKATIKTETDL